MRSCLFSFWSFRRKNWNVLGINIVSLVAEVKLYMFLLFDNDKLFIHIHNTVAHLNPSKKNCGAASVGSITRQFGFINLVDSVNWSPCKEIRKLTFAAF